MRVLLSVLVAVAVAQKKDKKGKKGKGPICYGLADENQTACMELDETVCGEDDLCRWGKDPVAAKEENMKKCMTKENMGVGKVCEKQEDCGCGMTCYFHAWMNKKACTACKDHGLKEDCDAAESMGCVWRGSENDGTCGYAKNDCNVLEKKECMGAKTKCMYDRKEKSCKRAYTPMCVGKVSDTHHLCHMKKTKEECATVVKATILGKSELCMWGFNKHEKEESHQTCMKETGAPIGKTCTAPADCTCGHTCLELEFFGTKSKSCAICKDMGVKADCETAAAAGMDCVWKGKNDDEGICLKKDMCADEMDEGECKKMMLCAYDSQEGACVKRKVDKKMCKNLGKQAEGEKMCSAQPECSYKAPKKQGKKGKCSLRK